MKRKLILQLDLWKRSIYSIIHWATVACWIRQWSMAPLARVQISVDPNHFYCNFYYNLQLQFIEIIESVVSTVRQLTLYLHFVEQSLEKINCVTTFEGVYQFSYEVDTGGGGICNHPDSQIKACQEPGSKYVDNEVFVMTYRKCLDVSTSKNERMLICCHLYKTRFTRSQIEQWFYQFSK